MQTSRRAVTVMVLISLALGVTVAATAATGIIALGVYGSRFDPSALDEHECECCA